MIPTLYRGSVKDVLGPVGDAVVFDYTDAYSVFDWGRMPDELSRKGEALAVMAAEFFEALESADSWRKLIKSPVASAMRRENPFGAEFERIGARLAQEGLRTHYRGAALGSAPLRLAQVQAPFRRLMVRQVSVVKPRLESAGGKILRDYSATRAAPAPRLVPLEVVFRFSCPAGSSLLERLAEDPGYLKKLGFGGFDARAGAKWEFPVLELFTKLEPSDRPVLMEEAVEMSGLAAERLREMQALTAWVAAFVRVRCEGSGVELADGKFEWAIDRDGGFLLVDAIGPDELRILKDGVQLSKEFLRAHYRATAWYADITEAKKRAAAEGVADWKKLARSAPPALPAELKEHAVQVYLALANRLGSRRWFPGAWELERVVSGIQALGRKGA